jgi:hypothetical protein
LLSAGVVLSFFTLIIDLPRVLDKERGGFFSSGFENCFCGALDGGFDFFGSHKASNSYHFFRQ